MARLGTASTAAASVKTASMAALISNSLHDGPAEQAGGFDDQDGDNQRQRDRQVQLVAYAGNISSGEVLEHADQEAADHGAERTGQAAEHGRGKSVDQHAQHHVRL